MPSLTFSGVNALTVLIHRCEGQYAANASASNLPGFTISAPTINGNATTPTAPRRPPRDELADRFIPAGRSLLLHESANRLLATQRSRPLYSARRHQPQDEAATDLRVIAGLPTVPALFFSPVVHYTGIARAAQAHNLRFADGTSALGACGSGGLVRLAAYPSTSFRFHHRHQLAPRARQVTVANPWFTTPACSASTQTPYVTMMPTQNINGDWDTGPGFSPDGAHDQSARRGNDARSRDGLFFADRRTGGSRDHASRRMRSCRRR